MSQRESPPMDHQEIHAHGIIDRYLSGELPEEVAARFEAHLLDCPQCLDEVHWSEDFRGAVRTAATQDQAQARAVGLLAWAARRTRAQRWALMAAAALLAVIPPAGLLWQQQRLQAELSQARAAARQAERQAQTAQAALGAQTRPAPGTEAAPGVPVSPRPDLEAALAQERQTSARLRQQLDDVANPGVATLIALGFVRSGPGDEQRVHLNGRPAWTVLSIELPDTDYSTYDATLRNSSGKVLWAGQRIEPTPEETLLLSFPPSFLSPGSYRVQLEGRDPHGEPQPAGEIRFRLLPGEGG